MQDATAVFNYIAKCIYYHRLGSKTFLLAKLLPGLLHEACLVPRSVYEAPLPQLGR